MGFRIQVGRSEKHYFFCFGLSLYLHFNQFFSLYVICVLWKMLADLCIVLYKESLQVFQKSCVQNTGKLIFIPTRIYFNDVGTFSFLGLQISSN